MTLTPAAAYGPVSGTLFPSTTPLPPEQTGEGECRCAPSIHQIRKDLGLPVSFRVGIAWMNGRAIGPDPEHIPEAIHDLYQYLQVAGDPHMKGFQAAHYILALHPYTDGNGRTAREMYRRITGEDTPRYILRPALTARLELLTASARGENIGARLIIERSVQGLN